MNSYKDFKALFKRDLVLFGKLNGYYNVRVKNNDYVFNNISLISPDTDNYLEKNISPYFFIIEKHREYFLDVLNISDNLIDFFKELLELNVKAVRMIDYITQNNIFKGVVKCRAREIEIFLNDKFVGYKSISLNLPMIRNKNIYDNIEFKYCFETKNLYCDGDVLLFENLKLKLKEYESCFIEQSNIILKDRYKEIEGNINECFK